MLFGLPTQDEINRWDDHQRAAGHQMVRVLPSKKATQRCLEAAEPIKVELYQASGGWVALIVGMDDYESDLMPTAHEALREAAQLLEQFWVAFGRICDDRPV